MKLQGKAWLCAIILVAFAVVLLPSPASAQTRSAAESLDGQWLTDGYGGFIELQGDTLRRYEITTISCIALAKASSKTGSDNANEAVFVDDNGVTFRVSSAASAETRWLHEDGSVSNILLRRTNSRPEPCGKPLSDSPLTNYQVFWETFAEHYPFFALRHMDWVAVDKKFRPQVTLDTKPEELFRIFDDMLDPLHDAHTFIHAMSIQKRFRGRRPSADPMQEKHAARITEIIETKYVRGGLQDFCNKQLQFGLLRSSSHALSTDSEGGAQTDGIGYLRIHSFDDYSNDREFMKQLDTLELALDDIFKDSTRLTGLVIDVRINGGGSDVFGISIASRLATHEYLAYAKVTRNDIRDPDHRTTPQPVIVHVSQRPGFRGPVVLLTSADSISAAETFTMALLDRDPHVVRVGAHTQGVFSDVLARTLPNGWTFGLPNEIYLTKDGKAFDGIGVPPDMDVPVFSTKDLTNGRDSVLDKALELLTHKAR